MIKIKHCFLCENINLNKIFSAIDYIATKEKFDILECPKCEIRITSPLPKKNQLKKYYESKNYRPHKKKTYSIIDLLYNIIRKYMFFKKRKLIEKHSHLKKGKILDIGCGTGEFASFMKNSGWDVVCVDSSNEARSIAMQRFNLKVLNIDQFFDLKNIRFDVITMWHTLEHVDKPIEYINKVNKILNDDGKFIFAVPNYESFDSKFFGKYWAANDVPRHLYHYSKKSVKKILKKSNLLVSNIIGLPFDAYYVSYLSSRYKKTSLLNSLLVGFISNFKAKYTNNMYSSLIYIGKKNMIERE